MRLWTIQHRDFLASRDEMLFQAEWRHTPQNWRPAYLWMAQQFIDRIDLCFESAPIWCWHSCNGQIGAFPTVGTAAALIGDWDYFSPKMNVIEMTMPDELALLSSYTIWNEALDHALDHSADTIDSRGFEAMFEEPLLKHNIDDIQAVIPHILQEWIDDIRPLPPTDHDWDAAI